MYIVLDVYGSEDIIYCYERNQTMTYKQTEIAIEIELEIKANGFIPVTGG